MAGARGARGELEAALRREGIRWLAGVDEVGRGPLAGPVVAACVVLGPDWVDPGVDDSKRLTAARRETLAAAVRTTAAGWALGSATPEEVDRLNIHRASLLAMARAVAGVAGRAEYLLVDGRFYPEVGLPGRAVVAGDALCATVAAASILAKVERDRLMTEWHRAYPQYNFAANKGYGTAEHQAALRRYGPCPLHRQSFAPVAQLCLGLGA